MMQNEYQEVRRDALMRAVAIIQQYQNANWRRLRVNDICADLKRLIQEEAKFCTRLKDLTQEEVSSPCQ